MKQNYINKIRESCIKARYVDVPEAVVEWYVNNGKDIFNLADVLLVIYLKDVDISLTLEGKILITKQGDGCIWNLKETLENQSEPTKKFIAELLDNK